MTTAAEKRNSQTLKIMLAVLLPPVSVYLAEGATRRFWLNLVLTACFYVPGMIHATFIVIKTFKPVRNVKFDSQKN